MFKPKYYADSVYNKGSLRLRQSRIAHSHIFDTDDIHKNFNAALFIDGGDTVVEDSLFDGGYYAIAVHKGNGGSLTLSSTTMQHFTAGNGTLLLDTLIPTVTNNTIIDNSNNALYFSSLSFIEDAIISRDMVYSTHHLTVAPSTTLTLEAGSTVQLGSRADMVVEGTLLSQGTEDTPVTIAAATAGGVWGSLRLYGGSHHIAHTTISGGGLPYDKSSTMIRVFDTATVVFDTSRIIDSRRPGTLLQSNGSSIVSKDSEFGWSEPYHSTTRADIRGIYMSGGSLTLDNTNFFEMKVGIEAKNNSMVTTTNMTGAHFRRISLNKWFPMNLISL
jgi:hypothetical protein